MIVVAQVVSLCANNNLLKNVEELAENKFEGLFFNQVQTNSNATELSAPHRVYGHGPLVESVRVGPTLEEIAEFRNRQQLNHQKY